MGATYSRWDEDTGGGGNDGPHRGAECKTDAFGRQ
jgi:hypothetical protein